MFVGWTCCNWGVTKREKIDLFQMSLVVWGWGAEKKENKKEEEEHEEKEEKEEVTNR